MIDEIVNNDVIFNMIPIINRQNSFYFNNEAVLDNNVYKGLYNNDIEKKIVIYKSKSFNLNDSIFEVKLRRFKTF